MIEDYRIRWKGENNPNYKNSLHKTCKLCEKQYGSYSKKRKFCSNKCASESFKKLPELKWKYIPKKRLKKEPKQYFCSVCKIIEVKRKAKFCKPCRKKGSKVTTNCKNCQLSCIGWKGRSKKFCSKSCQYKFYKGKGNPHYIDGRNPINKAIRNSQEYKLWREAVFKRDNWICQECGQVGGELNADHIKPFALFRELRLSLNNGRTLCVNCHRKIGWKGSHL